MTRRTLQILLALGDGPLHGYGIRHAVQEATGGRVRLGSGTLYEAIQRLEADGLIGEVDAPDDARESGGPPRRFYALTSAGRSALRDELDGLDEMLRWARERALLGG